MNKRIYYIILFMLMATFIVAAITVSEYYVDTEQNIVAPTPDPPEDNIELEIIINQSDVELLAKTVYGEARGCTIEEQSAVIWCILNRVDAEMGTIEEVVTAPYQFAGYKPSHPVTEDFASLAVDVLLRWHLENYAVGMVGRTLPKEYLWFHGDGKQNHFRDKYSGDYTIWDWNYPNPYLTTQE